jgi:plasmid stabilization system protein ParE
MGKIVIWSRQALKQTEQVHKHILEETLSLKTADKVINALFDSSEVLENQPELYPLDRFKIKNNGTYRAYEKYHYRITYRVLKDKIRILRVRHTSREPLKH